MVSYGCRFWCWAYGSFCPNAELSCFIIYCITAVSSVLTTMFFFLPVIKNLLQGKGIDTSGGWFIGFHAGLKDIFKGCFFLTVPYTGQGLTLFCGSVSLIALIGFFIGRKQNLKAKLWTLGYLLFLFYAPPLSHWKISGMASALFLPITVVSHS